MSEVLSDQWLRSSEKGALTNPKIIRTVELMTHSDFIEKLGGGTAIAQALSDELPKPVDREAVYKWARNGIPHKWRPRLVRMARDKGVSIPSDFEMGDAA